MEQGILDLIGEAACSDSSECAAIWFGAKPCGGPWRHQVYSKSTVDEEALEVLVEGHYEFNRLFNERYGIYSDCSIATSANPGCVEGVCVDLNRLP